MDAYDPFRPGRLRSTLHEFEARDATRDRLFPIAAWTPATSEARALVVFSHASGGNRGQSSFLCRHLASHGYLVAAMDHSETIAASLRRPEGGEPADRRAARIDGWIANRVPDIRFLLDEVQRRAGVSLPRIDGSRAGIAGHSFGGWTALATPEIDSRIACIAALAPAGSSNPPPGIIPCKLTFAWGRVIPTLYLVAGDDTALPMEGMLELFGRTAAPRRMFVLRKADHGHFFDTFDPKAGEAPIAAAQAFTRSLVLAHFDAALSGEARALDFLDSAAAALAAQGVDAFEVEAS